MGRKRQQLQRDWAEIPTDALSVIFEKLGAADVLLSAQAVCLSWRKLALDPTIPVWRCINMRHFPQYKFPLHLPFVAHIQKLHVFNRCGSFLANIAGRTPSLKCISLTLFPFPTKDLAILLSHCPLLEELCISSCMLDDKLILEIGQLCPALKSLQLDGRTTSLDCGTDSDSDFDYKNFIKTQETEDSSEEDWNDEDSGEEDSSEEEDSGEEYSGEEYSGNESPGGDGKEDKEENSCFYSDSSTTVYNWNDSICHDRLAREIANNMHQLRKLRIVRLGITNKGLHDILDNCLHLESLDIRCCFHLRVDAVIQAKLAKIKNVRVSPQCLVSLVN